MDDISSEIKTITSRLLKQEKDIVSVAKLIKENINIDSNVVNPFLEDFIIKTIELKTEPTITIGGIDGGLLKKEYHGANIVITRAVCAIFDYKLGKLKDSKYYPSAVPKPQIHLIDSCGDANELKSVASVIRLDCELGLACQILENESDLDFLFLDGSVVLHPSVLNGFSGQNNKHDELVEIVNNMYKSAIKKDAKTLLVGVVEDSRSQMFIQNLKSIFGSQKIKIIDNVRDTHILTHVLSVGERTAVFKTVENNVKNNEFKDYLFSFYMRPSEFDRALRIDFVARDPVITADKIAEALYFMSRHNSTYGIPPVIIDADLRAKLLKTELILVENEIKKGIGHLSSFEELRRNLRPV